MVVFLHFDSTVAGLEKKRLIAWRIFFRLFANTLPRSINDQLWEQLNSSSPSFATFGESPVASSTNLGSVIWQTR